MTAFSESEEPPDMFNVETKRKKKKIECNFSTMTGRYLEPVRNEVTRPKNMPDSLSLPDLCGYMVNYPTIFTPKEVNLMDPVHLKRLKMRMKEIIVKRYDDQPLKINRRTLDRKIAEELTADGGEWAFLRRFEDNWFVIKLMHLRYKTYRFNRSHADRGIPRSAQRPSETNKQYQLPNHQFRTKDYVYDQDKHSNAGVVQPVNTSLVVAVQRGQTPCGGVQVARSGTIQVTDQTMGKMRHAENTTQEKTVNTSQEAHLQ